MSALTLTAEKLPAATLLGSLRTSEGLSRLYRIELGVFVPTADFAGVEELIGTRATVKIAAEPAAGSTPAQLHGVFTDVEVLRSFGDRVLLRANLRPQLWLLTLSHHSRVFTKKSCKDAISAVLKDAGLPTSAFEFQLQADPPVEEHICQYHESDFDFVARWLDREGLYFYFDHTGSSEKLIITNDKATQQKSPADPVRYHPVAAGDTSAKQSLQSFSRSEQALVGTIELRDYDYAQPSLAVAGSAPVAANGGGEHVSHGERFFAPEDGKRLAKLRAEAQLATERTFAAHGTVVGFSPGFTFTLQDHPEGDLDRDYLCTALSQTARQAMASDEIARLLDHQFPQGFRVELEAIFDSVQYRHGRRTAWPHVAGYECGVVDGPAKSDYAQLDDQGRYLVKMSFDESDLKDGNASTRLRMMQPHTGNPEGWHLPLRNGTEVLVGFLGGDPDRPFIAGAVPNAHNPSVVTESNHTQNVLHTGGNNRIELEDEKDKQYIDLFTPPKNTYFHLGEPHKSEDTGGKHTHYIVKNTEGNCLFEIGSNQDIFVGGKLTEHVHGAVKETYSATQLTKIDGPQTTHVTGAVSETYGASQLTSVGAKTTEKYHAGQKSTVGGAKLEIYCSKQTTTVTAGVKEDYTGPHVKVVAGGTQQLHKADLKTLVTGPVIQSFASTVNFGYGPTKATNASMLWIVPGGIRMNAPNWSVHCPSKKRFYTNFKAAWAQAFHPKGSSAKTTGLKLELTGSSAAVTGFKREQSDLALSIEGFKFERYGLKLEVGGACIQILAKKTVK